MMIELPSGLFLFVFVFAGTVLFICLLISHLALRKRDRRQGAELSVTRMELDQVRERDRDAEQELSLHENWKNVLSNITGDMLFVHGMDEEGLPGQFIYANDMACSKLGYLKAKLLTMTPLDIESYQTPEVTAYGHAHAGADPFEDHDTGTDGRIIDVERKLATQRLVRQIIETRQVVYERVYETRNGVKVPVEINAHRLDLPDKSIIIYSAHDLTERYAVKQALFESERRSRDFLAHSPIGVVIYDGNRTIEHINQICLKMFGVPDREQFSQFNMFDNAFLPPDVKEAIDRGQSVRYETIVDFNVVREKGMFISSRTGQAHLDILMNNLGFDRDFSPKGYLVQVQDISRRREVEAALQQSEIQLRQAQKLQAIGTLAGGIAHDFNNILTPILGYSEMSLDLCAKNDPMHNYLQEIIKASLRAKELANQILTFSRQAEPDGKPIRITPIVKEVLSLQRASLPKSIEMERTIKTTRDVVTADPTQIHQVMMNLCANASHAMRDTGGTLEVVMTDFMLNSPSTSEFPNLEPGRYLRISVKDTGTGMDPTVAERIFEPFFTTKDRGEGTGMGLAVVHGIVTSLNGTTTVDTRMGHGSVFHVILPVLETAAEPTAAGTLPVPSGTECILFVDDEPEIVKMESQMLSALGYRIVAANSAVEALKVFQENLDRFDIVITDQVMPEMSGTDLTRHILELRPNMPIILCTGFSEGLSRQHAESLGITEVIMKPVAKRDLAKTIRRSLDVARAT